MVLTDWVLPILIGIVASVMLLSILYTNKKLRQKFTDLGALIQLQTSRPAYYGLGWVPINFNDKLPVSPTPQKITTIDTPLLDEGVSPYPIYNYYPNTPIMATIPKMDTNIKDSDEMAFNPGLVFHPYDAVYYGMSGYPPVVMYPPTNIDKVKGVQDKF
jgi:hypothetical protein